MGLIGRLRLRNPAAMALLLAGAVAVGGAAAQTAKQPSAPAVDRGAGPAPAARIAVGPLGYAAPSSTYLSVKFAFNSLNFIDSDHLLFTFHRNMLLRRIPGDPVDDDDQMIRAVVLDTKSGKVLRQADWRMHDRGRYLWALRGGAFLVRVRNSLFLTDSTLTLRPYLTFVTGLQGVEVSPGRGLLMLEVKKPLAPEKNEVEGDGGSRLPPSLVAPGGVGQARTQMVLVRPGEREALAKAEFATPAHVPMLENGILDMDQGKKPNQWVITEEMLDKTTAEVGVVTSSCAPRLVTLSDDVVLSRNCPNRGGSGTPVSALSLKGGVLWQALWDAKYIWGQFELSEDGSRFAYASLEMNRPVGTMDSFGEADVAAQPVGVFDTETGNLVMVKDASPILSAGQNFALSADGRRFAILRDGAIEVYDLPAVVAAAAPETGKKK